MTAADGRFERVTVLSDREIRTRMGSGELVPSGDPANAQECSYSFVPGRAFLAGSQEPPVDFPGVDGNARIVVEPGKMVWIRTRDRVSIPNDLVGFWWQTNTLSRKGLMLVNMSMVEPGYEGDLACLFVNFGKGRVLIDARTTIAKMVFVDIRGTVDRPFLDRKTTSRYDFALNELALDQPSSFLQVGDLANGLKAATASALADIRAADVDVRTKAAQDLASARKDAVEDFKKDIPGALKGSFGWALAGFAILTAVTVGTDFMKGKLTPDVKEIARSEAEEALRQRVTIAATPNSTESAILLRRIDDLNKRIALLEKRKP